MKVRYAIIIILICSFLAMPFSVTETRASGLKDSYVFELVGNNYGIGGFGGDLVAGTEIGGNFTVLYGLNTTFFICDTSNANAFAAGQPFVSYEMHQNVNSLCWNFLVPYTAEWHYIFDNRDSSTTKWIMINDALNVTSPIINVQSPISNITTYNMTETAQSLPFTVIASASDNISLTSFKLLLDGKLLVDNGSTGQISETIQVSPSIEGYGSHYIDLIAINWCGLNETLRYWIQINRSGTSGGLGSGAPSPILPFLVLSAAVAVVVVVGIVVFFRRKK